jgi:hypothetical protein
MSGFTRQSFYWLTWLWLGLLALQFFLAGYGVFGGDFEPHMAVGGLILHIVLPLLMLIAVIAGRVGLREALAVFGIFVLLTVQIAMVDAGKNEPWIAALHPFLAFMAGVYVYLVVLRMAKRALAAAPSAVPAAVTESGTA